MSAYRSLDMTRFQNALLSRRAGCRFGRRDVGTLSGREHPEYRPVVMQYIPGFHAWLGGPPIQVILDDQRRGEEARAAQAAAQEAELRRIAAVKRRRRAVLLLTDGAMTPRT